MRRIVLWMVVVFCLTAGRVEANPYSAYLAKYLGERLMGTLLANENSDTRKLDWVELDVHLNGLEGALSLVDMGMSAKIGNLRPDAPKRPTREQVRQIVADVLTDLEARITKLEPSTKDPVSQLDEVFEQIPNVPTALLIPSTTPEGEPSIHPLIAEWVLLLRDCETSRLTLKKLLISRHKYHPEFVAARKSERSLLAQVIAFHQKIKEKTVNQLDARMELLQEGYLETTPLDVQLVDEDLSPLLWLYHVSKPAPSGPRQGRLVIPEALVGSKCSEFLDVFRLVDLELSTQILFFRQLLRVKIQQTGGPDTTLSKELAVHLKTANRLDHQFLELANKVRRTRLSLEKRLKILSPAHPEVLVLQQTRQGLLRWIHKFHDEAEVAMIAALETYVATLKAELPTTARMIVYRHDVLQRLDDLATVSGCVKWDNDLATDQTWKNVSQWKRSTVLSQTLVNGLGMKFRLIPAGEFMMGSSLSPSEVFKAYPGGKSQYFLDEHPRHLVRITQPVYMAVYEVTVGDFKQFVEKTHYLTTAEREGTSRGLTSDGKWGNKRGLNWKNPGFSQTVRHPVTCVSWKDAKAYCNFISALDKEKYRLPTEAEWEYACRAGTDTVFFWGDEAKKGEGYLNAGGLEGLSNGWTWKFPFPFDDNEQATSRTGRYLPNPWGLYDMNGNVNEWCEDWYGNNYYRNSPTEDPKGPSSGVIRIFRGGSWSSLVWRCRSARRGGNSPGGRATGLGFRLVLVPSL